MLPKSHVEKFACLSSGLSMKLTIVAIFSNGWLISSEWSSGLFVRCDSLCYAIQNLPAALQISKTFLIISLVLLIYSFIITLLSNKNDKHFEVMGICMLSSGICSLIALITFSTTSFPLKVSEKEWWYGYSFILGWLSCFTSLPAACLSLKVKMASYSGPAVFQTNSV